MATYTCHECYEVFDYARRPGVRRCDPPCPGCGPGTKVTRIDDEREQDDDDGRTYADPRDERDERRMR